MAEQKIEETTDAQGETVIEEDVLRSIAGVAAKEVKGVASLGSSSIRRAIAGTVGGSQRQTHGIKVDVDKKEATVDIQLNIEYGYNIPDVLAQVRGKVSERLEQMAGLHVKQMNFHVGSIVFGDGEKAEKREKQAE